MAVQPVTFSLGLCEGNQYTSWAGSCFSSLFTKLWIELLFAHLSSFPSCPPELFLKIMIRTCTGRRQAWTTVIKCLAQRRPWKTSEKQFLQWAELSVVSLAPNFVCQGGNSSAVRMYVGTKAARHGLARWSGVWTDKIYKIEDSEFWKKSM